MDDRIRMTTTSTNDETHAVAQQWFARLLAPDCSETERAAFMRWRAADPAHDAAYRQVEAIWEHSAGLKDDSDIAAALQDALRPVRQRRRVWFDGWPSLATAATVVIAVALVLWSTWPGNTPPPMRYATALGEQQTITLEDGSQVVLDTDTELLVRFGQRERSLTLQRGQAGFTVQKDKNRPFVVNAASGTVTATGTQFQVRLTDRSGIVTLLEGQVVIASQSGEQRQTATLSPNERIVIQPDGHLTNRQRISVTELVGLRGWTEGNLVVEEWSLANAVAEMNRYSDTKLRLADPSLGSILVSGVFKTGDQKSFALALEYGWSIRADQRPAAREIVLSRK